MDDVCALFMGSRTQLARKELDEGQEAGSYREMWNVIHHTFIDPAQKVSPYGCVPGCLVCALISRVSEVHCRTCVLGHRMGLIAFWRC